MVHALIIFLTYILALILCRKCTRMFTLSIVLPITVVLWYRVNALDSFWTSALWFAAATLGMTLYLVIANRISYDFTGRVLSLRLIFNLLKPIAVDKSKANRVIGRVLPYNSYQLKYNGAAIISSEIAAAGSTLISGSTGSGKTYGIMSLMRQNIAHGDSIIFADYKGDPKEIAKLERYALNNGYEVYNLSSGASNFNYDPLRNLNNAGRIEGVMNMRKWSLDGSDAHYKTSTQLLLQKTIQEFSHRYAEMVKKVEMQGKDVSQISYTYEYYQYMKRYQAANNEYDAYTTVSKLLEILVTSSLDKMFTFQNEKTVALDRLKNSKFLLVVSFISSNREIATSFSSLLFRDLLDEFTNVPPRSNTFLYVDEFGTLENPFIIKDILEKGRSARIATTLSMQDINQIVIQTNEAYLNSILGTINTFIVYSGATRNTAEKFAGVQLADIEAVLMNLRKPDPEKGRKPTAIYISKYPTLNRKITSEVFRFEPYIFDQGLSRKQNAGVSRSISREVPQMDRSYREEFADLMEGKITESEAEVLRHLQEVESHKQDDQLVEGNLQEVPRKPLKLRISGDESKSNKQADDSLESLIFGDDHK